MKTAGKDSNVSNHNLENPHLQSECPWLEANFNPKATNNLVDSQFGDDFEASHLDAKEYKTTSASKDVHVTPDKSCLAQRLPNVGG